MKNKENVANLIAQLKAEIETPYELAAVERLERELIEGAPKVEVVDENHQKFLGFTFHKESHKHFRANIGIHQLVWFYYFGKVFEGWEIHHKNLVKSDNDIRNLIPLNKSEHQELHAKLRRQKQFICKICGKSFKAVNYGHNLYCSKECYKKAEQEREKKRVRVRIKDDERICPVCNKKFFVRKDSPTKFCSIKCFGKYRRHEALEVRSCILCNKEFEVNKSQKKKFCSRACASRWYHQQK